jgi:hypothetical protein
MRTKELMPFTDTKESTPIMKLRSKSRVHIGKAKSLPFGPISYSHYHQVEKPTVQLSTSSFADVFLLGLGLEIQVLEDQNGIHRSPLTELSSGFLAERPVAVVMFPGQPFQHSDDRPGVEMLCLLPSEFGLQTRTNLARLGVANGQRFSTDEQGFLVSRSDQGIVHPEVNAHGDDALGFWDFKGEAEESLAVGDSKAVDGLGGIKILAEVAGDFPANLLPTLKRRNGEASVPTKAEVLADEEKRSWFTEDKRTSGRFAIGLGTGISSSSCSDGVTPHLGSQCGRSLMVDQFLQFKGAKWSSVVETDWADGLLVTVKLQHSLIDESVRVEDYRYGSLDVHIDSIVTHPEKSKTCLENKRRRAIPLSAKADSFLARIQ